MTQPTMTRRHYRIIAGALAGMVDRRPNLADDFTFRAVVHNLEAALTEDNPRFDPEVFRQAIHLL